MKPNIFQIARKALPQQAFYTWLAQWANQQYNKVDELLNETAKSFVRLLIGQSSDYPISKVDFCSSPDSTDIYFIVNEDHLVTIDCFSNINGHSEILDCHKRNALEIGKSRQLKPVFVYLKTNEESSKLINEIALLGYSIIEQNKVLNTINKRPIQNEIFMDFLSCLNAIENQNNRYKRIEKLPNELQKAEDFFNELSQFLDEWSQWRYVANQKGGFLGFWPCRTSASKYKIYIQVESNLELGMKIILKIGDWQPNIKTLNQVFLGLQPYAAKYGLTITKPDHFTLAPVSILGYVQNVIYSGRKGNLDIEEFIQTIKSLELVLDEYHQSVDQAIKKKLKVIMYKLENIQQQKTEILQTKKFELAAGLREQEKNLLARMEKLTG
jgi:hypothetical protein